MIGKTRSDALSYIKETSGQVFPGSAAPAGLLPWLIPLPMVDFGFERFLKTRQMSIIGERRSGQNRQGAGHRNWRAL